MLFGLCYASGGFVFVTKNRYYSNAYIIIVVLAQGKKALDAFT